MGSRPGAGLTSPLRGTASINAGVRRAAPLARFGHWWCLPRACTCVLKGMAYQGRGKGREGEKSRSKRRRWERDYLDGQEMAEEELRASRASRSQLASISVQDLDDGGWIWRRHGRRSTFSLDLSLLLSSSEGIGWERVVAKAVGERVEAMAGGDVLAAQR